ncbi:hypothetical protein DVH24_019739, partial [Malus domestica]
NRLGLGTGWVGPIFEGTGPEETWGGPGITIPKIGTGPYSARLKRAGFAFANSSTNSTFCPLTAIWRAVWPLLSFLIADPVSLLKRAWTTSKCPFLAAECKAVFPLLLAMDIKLQPVSKRKLTTSVCPCAAAMCNAVVFARSTVIESSGIDSMRIFSTSETLKEQFKMIRLISYMLSISIMVYKTFLVSYKIHKSNEVRTVYARNQIFFCDYKALF